jgi:hypothetical protein
VETAFVYHLVPGNLKGSILYPLNRLRDIHPEIAAEHAAKYQGREETMQMRVEPLNCMCFSSPPSIP